MNIQSSLGRGGPHVRSGAAPSPPLMGREYPEDDGYCFRARPGVWACWSCRKTAKPEAAFSRRAKASRARDPIDRDFPCCPSCGEPMSYMGMKWRPGRKGKWKTGAEIDAIAQERARRRDPVRVGFVVRKPRWTAGEKGGR